MGHRLRGMGNSCEDRIAGYHHNSGNSEEDREEGRSLSFHDVQKQSVDCRRSTQLSHLLPIARIRLCLQSFVQAF